MVGEPKRDPLAVLAALIDGPGLFAGSFESQDKQRSNKILQKMGLEWLDRLIRGRDRGSDDQRSEIMRAIILRALLENGEIGQVTDWTSWEEYTTWLAKRLINDSSAPASVIVSSLPSSILAKEQTSALRTVAVDSVIRSGSYFTAAISIMSLVATAMSNVVIIQPFVALFFLIASIGFFCMTLMPHDADR
jgi:hypothetical protein